MNEEVASKVIHSLKLFLWATFIWALPSLIPTMDPMPRDAYIIYKWVSWPVNVICLILVFKAARMMGKALTLMTPPNS